MAGTTQLSFEDLKKIQQWNEFVPKVVNRCVHDIFADQVALNPSAEAVCAYDGSFSYAELDDASTRLAQYLVETYGIVTETFVALAFDKSVWNVVAMLGVLKAGAAFIPLDPNAPHGRLESLCQRTESRLLLCSATRAQDFSGIASTVLGVDGELIDGLPDAKSIDQASGSEYLKAAYLIFTSGSTGEPKGTIIEHRALATSVSNHGPRMFMDSNSRVLQFAAHTFDASVQEILTTLLVGGTVCIVDEHSRLNNIAKSINDMQVNWACLTPSVVDFILPPDVPGLRTLILVGEPMTQTHLNTWAPHTRLINGYGPSECTIAAIANINITTNTHPLDIGYPIGVYCWVVHSDDHNILVPVGSEGELLIQGPTLARGYLDDPAKTKESFIQSPHWTKDIFGDVSADRMYKTGDIVRQNPDGSFRFVGRKDNQVKVHGQRVELGEIEVNLHLDPAVKQCLVLLPKAGPLKGRLVAFVSLHDDGITQGGIEPITTKGDCQVVRSVAGRLQGILPSYMIPFMIAITAIPRQTSGKLDRKRALVWLEAMDSDTYQNIVQAVEPEGDPSTTFKPTGEVENLLLKIWSRVLNLNPEKISLNRPFLSLGGDSISAMQVIGHCLKSNISLSVQDVLKAKSLSELAGRAKLMSGPASYTEVVEQEFALSPIQQLFFSLPNQGSGHFNQSFFLRVTQKISLNNLQSAVEAIVQRHSMLRARFTGTPIMQRITNDVSGSYRLKSHHIEAQNLATAAIDESQKSLNPFHGPLFGVDLFDITNDDQLLFMVGHHLVIDLVSWRVILEEMEELLSNTPRDWSVDRPFPFQTWCHLQTEHAQNVPVEKALPTTDIPPGDFKFWGMETEPNTYGNVSVEGFEIDSTITSQLLTNCHTAFRTEPIDILLSALIFSFSRAFQNRTVPIYTEGHGREPSSMDVNLSKTVGWFTTLYPIHVPASASHDLVETVKHVKDFRHKVPDNGRPYFASRCLTESGKEHFGRQWPLEITFNYLGQYQQLEREGSLLTPAENMAGEARGAGGVSDVGHDTPRFGLFEISAVIVQGKLRFSFTFNHKIKHKDLILNWITGCQETICQIVERLSQTASQLTLSDLPLLSLTYEGLNKVIEETLPSLGVTNPNEIESIYPCSSIQEGLLISQSRNASSYEDHVIYELETRANSMPDVHQLVKAWKLVVQRHPTLRTIFLNHVGDDDGIYDQVVLKRVSLDVSVWDCKDEEDALDRLNIPSLKLRDKYGHPPHQFIVCQTSDNRIFCKVEISHTIIDGESMSIIFRDLALAYEGRLDESSGPLYSDYVAYLQSLHEFEGLDYWKSYLTGVEPCHVPILNDGISVSNELRSMRLGFEHSDFLSLQQFCESNGFTLSNALHTAWALTLRLYTGSEEVCFGYLSSNRDVPIENLKDAVGPYINMLVCRLTIGASTGLNEIIRQVQNDYVESLPHKHVSLAEVQHALKLSGTPLFNTSLSYRRLPSTSDHKNENVSFTQCCPTYDPTEYPLSINIESSEDSAAIDLDYWTNHISDGQAAHISRTFMQALQNIVQKSECAVGQLQNLSADDHQQIMTWNNKMPETLNDCVHKVIEKQARLQPDGPAVSGWDGSFTFSELNRISSKLAAELIALGVGPEVFVPTCFEKSSWTIVAMIAILKAGGATVPLDPQHPKAALELRIHDTKAKIILTAPNLAHLFVDLVPHVISVSSTFVDTLPDHDSNKLCPSVQPTDPCVIIYTSGSTGKPKGVVLEHRNLVTSCHAHGSLYGHGPGTRVLQFSAYTFDNSLEDILTTLMLGGCVCVPSESDRYGNLAGVINEMDVNFMSLTPTVASLLHPSQVPKIKGVSLGGEPLTRENVDVWADAVRLQGGYGPSECSINATWVELNRDTEPTNIGRSIGSVSWIVDPSDYNILLPIGCVGELLIDGPIVARGYLNDEKKTAASFISEPAWARGTNRKIYRTGDLVRYNSDGTIVYLGRRDTQVKLNGQRLEIGEIEHHVKASLSSGTRSAVELVKPNNGTKVLAAFFTVTSAKAPASSEVHLIPMDESISLIARNLEAGLLKALPKYMVPTLYIPVSLIPTTASEKVDRRKLRTLCESLSDHQASEYRLVSQSTRKLSSEMEKKLGVLWESVLKLKEGSVGADDDFFEVGGDSIGAMRLMTVARQQGISISVTSIFRKSTLSDLAKEIEQQPGSVVVSEPEELVLADPEPFSLLKSSTSMFKTIKTIAEICQVDPESVQDIYPASALQEGLVSLALKNPGAYVAQNVYQLPANINLTRFKESWAKVLVDECILRSRVVHTKEDGFLQVVVDEPLVWHEFSSMEDLPLDSRLFPAYNGGALSSYTIIGASSPNPKFIWTAHHAIYDGWCIPAIFEKVEAYYQSSSMSDAADSIPFSRFIKYLSGIDQDNSDAFWRSKLLETSAVPYPALPHPAYQVQATSILKHTSPILRAPGSRITLPSTIRAAWALTLSVYSGSEDVVFGEILTGRDIPVPGIVDMIGPTLATVPTRIPIENATSVSAFLQNVQVSSAEVVQFQHAGLQRIKQLSEDTAVACSFQNVLVINGDSEPPPTSEIFDLLSSSTAGKNFSSYPLSLVCDVEDGNLSVEAHYDSEVVSTWEVERLVNQFDYFLQQVNSQNSGSEKLGRIRILSPADEASIQSWNSEPLKRVKNCIHHIIENQAQLQPATKIAVDSYDAILTFHQLDNLSTRLAQHLVQQNVNDPIIPFCFEKSAWAIVSMLAIMKAGKAFVPLDPSSPVSRLRDIIGDVKSDYVLCSAKHRELGQKLAKSAIVVDQPMIDSLPLSQIDLLCCSSETPAYVIFTSGSTGKPKGTIVDHSAFCSSAAIHGPALQLSSSSRALQFASYSWDVSILEIFTTLTLGGSVCVPDEDSRLNNISKFMAEKNVNWAALTPTFAQTIKPSDVPTLATLALGGEKMSRQDIATWCDRVTLVNAYGPSECAVSTSACRKVDLSIDPANIGFATGSHTWIVDPQNHDRLAPVGSVGELVVEGPLSRGYLNDPIKTAAAFIENPVWAMPKDYMTTLPRRFYKTGDLVRYLADGSMIFCRRKDNQTKIRGQRVEVGEIEHNLREDASIKHILVFVPSAGHCKSRLVAVLSLNEIEPPTSSSDFEIVSNYISSQYLTKIKEHLCDRLPAYMIPSHWIVLQKLPFLTSGKLDRGRTKKWIENLDEETYRKICDIEQEELNEPTTDLESRLRKIWSEVLNLPQEKISLHKSFIHVGGDSITAMQVMSRCRSDGLGITVQNILQSKSISQLAQCVSLPEERVIAEEKVDMLFDLSPVQRLYFEAVGDEKMHFNQSTVLRFSRKLDPASVGRAIGALVKTHSMLRSRFSKNETGVWQQRVITFSPNAWRMKSLRTSKDLLEQLVRESQESLDIEDGPTFAADLFDLGDEQVLSLIAHHLVIDVVSWRIIMQDLEEMLKSNQYILPMSLSFQTWSQLQTERAQKTTSTATLCFDDVPAADFDYWGMQGKPNVYSDVLTENFKIGEEASSNLLGSSHNALNTEPVDIFIASTLYALQKTFSDRSTTPTIYNEGHGREIWNGSDLDLSRTVGWFTTICPLYLPNTASETIDLVDTVRWIKDLRSRIPAKGREYFDFRYLTEAGREKYSSHWPMEVTFNYLGKIQQLERKDSLLQPVETFSSGDSDIGFHMSRFSLLDISVIAKNGQIEFSVSYNKQMKHQAKIRSFIQECQASLEEVMHRLLQLKPERTLSDFPLLPLSFNGLERLVEKLPILGVSSLDDIEDAYPCSPMQLGLLLSQAKNPDFYAYYSVFEIRSSKYARVNITNLIQAWKDIIRQHATLRTIFIDGVCRDGEVGQIVVREYEPKILQLQCEDRDVQTMLSQQPPPEFSEPQPPHRLTICETSAGRVFARLEMSHALSDGTSFPILLEDLSVAYERRINAGHNLEALSAPRYSDYIAHIKKTSDAGMKYWKSYLSGIEPCRFPSVNDGVKDENCHLTHSIELADLIPLRQFCSEHGVTVSNALQLVWGLIMKLYTGSDEICFGYLTSGRDAPIAGLPDRALGTFINMLICRMNFTATPLLSDSLKRIQSDYSNGIEHQSCSLGDVQHELQLSGTSLFNTVFTFQNRSSIEKKSNLLQFDILDTHDPSEYDIGVNVEAWESKIEISIGYWTNCISEVQAANMAQTYEHIVNTMATASPNQLIADFNFLGQHSQNQIMAWNKSLPQPIEKRVQDLILEQQLSRPLDTQAVCSWDLNLTYTELNELTTTLAFHLVELGVGPEVCVPVCFGKSTWAVVGILAILKAGGAFVPVDASYPQSRLKHIIDDVGARIVLCSQQHQNKFQGLVKTPFVVDSASISILPTGLDSSQLPPVTPKNAAIVLYTSGTTGQPKGTITEHTSFCTGAVNFAKGVHLTSKSRALQFASLTFDAAIMEIVTTLLVGGCVCIPSDFERFNDIPGAVKRMDVNWMFSTPAMASTLIPRTLPSLKTLAMGGEAISATDVMKWQGRVCLIDAYGPSEATVISTTNMLLDEEGNPVKTGMDNIGKAVAGRTWVVDAKNHDRLMPIGTVGELVVEGRGVARGYLNNPAKTAAAFIESPAWLRNIEPRERLYKTGDLVRYNSDGSVSFISRKDTQIKLNGQRIEISEIEFHVKANIPSDTDAAVEMVTRGKSKAIAVFLCPKLAKPSKEILLPMSEDARSLSRDLDTSLASKLPAYMIPTLFIPVTNLPTKVSSGKLDRAMLRDIVRDMPADAVAGYRLSSNINKRAPKTTMEKKLQKLWETVLEIKTAGSVGAEDSFFRLGGDSITAMRLVVAARAQGIQLDVVSIFRSPKLSDLAALCAASSDSKELVHAAPQPFSLLASDSVDDLIAEISAECKVSRDTVIDAYPCSPLQEALITLSTKQVGAYVATHVFRLAADTDLQLFKAAWQRVVEVVDVLRLRIVHLKSTEFVQAVFANPQINWETANSINEAKEKGENLPSSNGAALTRYTLVNSDKLDNRFFVWSIHHSLYDGWSLPAVLRLVETAYLDSLAPLASSCYSSFIQYLSNNDLDKSDEFWKSKLNRASPIQFPPNLITDVDHTRKIEIANHCAILARDTSRTGVTISSIIRGAWSLVVSAHSGSSDVVYGEVLAGRDISVTGIQDIMGPTIAIVPNRTFINFEATIESFLTGIQKAATETIPFQHAGLQRIKSLNSDAATSCDFQNLLVIQPTAGDEAEAGIWAQHNDGSVQSNFSTYPLMIECHTGSGKVNLTAYYDKTVISKWIVEKLLFQFDSVMNQLVSSPNSGAPLKIRNIQVCSPQDVDQISTWNAAEPELTDRCLHAAFEQNASLRPDAIAVCAWDGELTYKELHDHAAKLAHHLINLKVGPEIFVPICMDKSAWVVVAILGVLMAGGAYVPLDPASPLSRHEIIVKNINAELVLCSAKYSDRFAKTIRTSLVIDKDALTRLSSPTKHLSSQVTSRNAAYIIYTSGSTGTPKGVVIEHRSISSSIWSWRKKYPITTKSRIFHFGSLAFDASLFEIFGALTHGACVCIPSEESRLSNLAESINAFQANMTFITPSLANILEPSEVSSLEVMVCGGEALGPEVVDKWATKVNLIGGYGPTECAVFSTENSRLCELRNPFNIGYAFLAARTWVVDPNNHNQLMPLGGMGELLIEGPILSRGYLKNPEKTAEVFITNPTWSKSFPTLDSTRRFYKTGDLVKYETDGSLIYIGRKDNQVKVRGQRIELGEIEFAICRNLAVRNGLVMVPKSGPFKKRLVAIVSLNDFKPPMVEGRGCALLQNEADSVKAISLCAGIREQVAETLPGYMVPDSWLTVEAIPLTTSGKAERSNIQRWLEAIDQETYNKIMTRSTEDSLEENLSDTEKLLQITIARVLNLHINEVRLKSSFLGLGGDSITAMQLLALCRKDNIQLTLPEVLRSKSISQLASICRHEGEVTYAEERLDHDFDLSPIQKMYFSTQEKPEQRRGKRFNQSFLLKLSKSVAVQKMQEAIKQLVHHHSMLRARFSKNESGVWQQRVPKDEVHSYRFCTYDVDYEDDVPQFIDISQNSLDIQRGPVFSVDLFNMKDEQVMFLVGHHAVVDMVSWRIILQDLEDILISGKLTSKKPLSFQTWCSMQAEESQKTPTGGLKALLPFEIPPLGASYWSLGDKSNTYGDTNTQKFALDKATTIALFGESNNALHTEPVDLFISSIAHSFSRVFQDRKTPMIVNESHGREAWDPSIDLARTVGWFTSLCPLHVDIGPDDDDILNTLKKIKDIRSHIPGNGRPYFAYRHLNEEARHKFGDYDGPLEIMFNYLGKTQQLERDDSLLQQWQCPIAKEDENLLSDVGPRTARLALIEISAVVIDEQLQFSFVFNRHMKYQQKLQHWVSELKGTLEEVVRKISSLKEQRVLTLSDFPLLPLSYSGLQKLSNEILPAVGIRPEDVEDIYPVAPMQEGMLLGQLRDPQFYQFHTAFEVKPAPGGRVDAKRLANAWLYVVNRHAALRTIFVDSVYRSDVFNQVVVRKVNRESTVVLCKGSDVMKKIEGFSASTIGDLERPHFPHQFTVFQTPQNRVYAKLEMNHAVMDASSLPILFHDLVAGYEGKTTHTPAPLYRSYIEYLKQQPPGVDTQFWKSYLGGVRTCNFPSLNTAPTNHKELGSAQLIFDRFPELQTWCKARKLTLANVMKAAWTLCLRHYTHSEDVCFGYLASGRDLPVEGIQETVGPLINMLVCRVNFARVSSLEELVQKVQDDYFQGLEHQHTSLAQIQHELNLSGASLFNTAVSIQGGDAIAGDQSSSISFKPVAADDPTEYALTISIGVAPGNEGAVLRFKPEFLSGEQADNLLDGLARVLNTVVTTPSVSLGNKKFFKEISSTDPTDPLVQLDQAAQLRTIVKECVSEIVAQMLNSGVLAAANPQTVNTVSNLVTSRISQPVQSTAPMVDYQQAPRKASVAEVASSKSDATESQEASDDMRPRLLALWSEHLQVPSNSIGNEDSFFQLGGDSIVAMRMVGAAREDGLSLTVADVFRCPVFEEMLDVVSLPKTTQHTSISNARAKQNTTPPAAVKVPRPTEQLIRRGSSNFSASPVLKRPQAIRRTSRRSNSNITDEVRDRRRSMYEEFSLIQEPNVEMFLRDNVCPKVGLFKGGIIDVLPATDFQALSITGSLLESRWMLNYFFLDGQGTLDLKRLRTAVNHVADAFDILRTVFIPYNGQFFQVVLRKLQPRFDVETVDDLDEFTGILRQRDCEYGPRPGQNYLQFTAAKLRNSDKHRIFIRISHAQYDGVCLPHILNALRFAFQGEPIPPSPSFTAYAREALGKTTNDHYRYWKELLHGSKMTDIVSRRGPSYGRGSELPTMLRRKVRMASLSSYGITSASIIKAAWSLILAQMSAEADIVFGNVISGRNVDVPELHSIVGPCVNTVPVRVPFQSGWTALDLLRHVQTQQVNNMPYESMGFREIIKSCTDWPDWTNFTTVCQHQNIETKPKMQIGSVMYEFGAVGSQEDFADLSVLSMPQENGLDTEICLMFSLSNIGMTKAAMKTIFDNLCNTAEDFSRNPTQVLPSPSEITSMRRQIQDPHVMQAAGMSVPLNTLNQKDLLVYSDLLIRCWRQVLGDPSMKIGPETSFFDLGGDLIGLSQVLALLEHEGFKLRLEDLMRFPVITEQLALLERFAKTEEEEDFGSRRKESEGEEFLAPAGRKPKGVKKVFGMAKSMMKSKSKSGRQAGIIEE